MFVDERLFLGELLPKISKEHIQQRAPYRMYCIATSWVPRVGAARPLCLAQSSRRTLNGASAAVGELDSGWTAWKAGVYVG